MSSTAQQPATTLPGGIAVIGLAGRFPGADSAEHFWENLVAGLSGVTSVEVGFRKSSLPGHPNFVAKAAVVKDADCFDAQFFGIYPKQAIDLDPQHRLFLEMCWHAMEDAGYVPDAAPGRVGVFAGCHMNTYIFTRLAADAEFRDSLADCFPGGGLNAEISNDKDYLATRVAYQLNLRGPSVAIQSACSTSLVAIAQACENLTSGCCDMALAGGVTVTFPQEQGYLHTEDSILSPDGTCRTFDADAKGTIFGDGVGAVVLKRVADAIADRDDIYAVIRGWGVNNDGGDKNGYTAPSVAGQAAAIRIAHRRAGISADSISYVEAHGTGTLVGDPIEVEALTQAFRETTDKIQFCRIASLKTNVGHLDVAAGVSSVIKTCMALKHRQIPPLLHFESPNPKIDFANSPFIVNTKLVPWDTDALPRRAGVSSFGVGGTNAHLIIEEAPPITSSISHRPRHLIRLSARSLESLAQMTEDLAVHLAANPDLDLADVAYTLSTGRKSFRHKRYLAARSVAEATQLLRQGKPQQLVTAKNRSADTPVVMMFPGQGSQHLTMAAELYRAEPVVRRAIDECAEVLRPVLNLDLRDFIDGTITDAESLDQTEIAQPALFMISYALGRWWQSLGVRPAMLVGHSVGEFAAAAIAGIMSMQDAARLVAIRGRLMQALPTGSMMAVQLPESQLRGILPERLEIAAINGPAFCVVSGPTEDVDAFAAAIDAGQYSEDIAVRPLRTSHAFHSRMMDPAIESFYQEVASLTLSPPTIPMTSNVTAQRLDDATATDPVYWSRQFREPVRFSVALAEVLKTFSGEVVMLEVGPNQALSTLARQHPLNTAREHIVSSLPHAKQPGSDYSCAIMSVGRLWQHGVKIDWNEIYSGELRRRVHLPKYRFQRKRYSFESELQLGAPVEAAAAPPLAIDLAPAMMPTPLASIPQNPAQVSRISQQVIQQQMALMSQQMMLLQSARAEQRRTTRH